MASPWTTYPPSSPRTGYVKPSEPDTSHPGDATTVTLPIWNSNAIYPNHAELARYFSTVPSELVEPGAKPPVEVPSVHGRMEPNSFASSVTEFTPANGRPMQTTRKTAPKSVSATSLSFKFREAGPPTSSTLRQVVSSSSLYDANSSAQSIPERPDSAVTHVIGSSLPSHIQVHVLRPSSSDTGSTRAWTPNSSGPVATKSNPGSTFERHVVASGRITNSSAVAPISAATNGPPSSPSITTSPILATDINATSSYNNGASQSTPPSVTLSPVLNRGRDNQERRADPRSNTGGTSVSGSASIVKSQYTDMVFEEVPRIYNILSFFFTWIILAGFIVLPGTFNTLEEIDSNTVKKVVHTIQHLPLYASFPT
jgi:hypothetical protein